MAARKEKAPRGALEVTVVFEPLAGGAPVEGVTTPSMWAVADEWCDTLRADGSHTDRWLELKMVDAICLQAAQAEGLMRGGAPTLARIAELKNLYSYEMTDGGDGGDADPNAQAPAGEA